MPIGTFTNSTHSQPAHSVSMPPSSTPTAPPDPATAPHTPIALLRSEPSANRTVTSESAAGESSAAPRPWTARAAISVPSLCGEPAGKRGDPEQDETDDEQPATTEQVGQAAAEQQEAAEHEHVRVDDPRQVVLGEVQISADRRQRDVDDRRVEDDDELGRCEQRQRQPLVGGAGRHGISWGGRSGSRLTGRYEIWNLSSGSVRGTIRSCDSACKCG